MRLLTFCLILILNIKGAYGQDTKPYGSLANQTSVREELSIASKNGIQNAYAYAKRYAGVQGDPFLYNRWIAGTVCLKKDSAIVENEKLNIKFNAFANELWILNGQDSMIAFAKDINWFSINMPMEKLTFEKHPDRFPANGNYFYRTVYQNDDFVLIQDARKKLKKADYVDRGMYTSGSMYDRFEDDSQYLLSYRGGEFAHVKLTVKSFTKALPQSFRKKAEAQAKKNMIPSKFSEPEAARFLESLKQTDR